MEMKQNEDRFIMITLLIKLTKSDEVQYRVAVS